MVLWTVSKWKVAFGGVWTLGIRWTTLIQNSRVLWFTCDSVWTSFKNTICQVLIKFLKTCRYSQAILWQIVILKPQSILVLYFFMIIYNHSLHLLSDITNIPNMLFRSLAGSTLDVSSRVSLVLCLQNFVPCYVPSFCNQAFPCFLQEILWKIILFVNVTFIWLLT